MRGTGLVTSAPRCEKPTSGAIPCATCSPIAEAALEVLEKLLPHKDPDHLRLKLLMAMTNVFHGLADYNYVRIIAWRCLPAPPSAPARSLSQ